MQPLYTSSTRELAQTLGVRLTGLPSPLSPLAETRPPSPEDAPPPLLAPGFNSESTRYELVREIGRGGMGHVDEIRDRALGRTVARKATLAHRDEAFAELLVAEAQI